MSSHQCYTRPHLGSKKPRQANEIGRGSLSMFKRVLIFHCILAFRLAAQVDTGAIVGTLRDPSGAAVSSATITIVEKSRNISTVVHSDDKGDYTSPPLHVGTYSVTAEVPGFKAE